MLIQRRTNRLFVMSARNFIKTKKQVRLIHMFLSFLFFFFFFSPLLFSVEFFSVFFFFLSSLQHFSFHSEAHDITRDLVFRCMSTRRYIYLTRSCGNAIFFFLLKKKILLLCWCSSLFPITHIHGKFLPNVSSVRYPTCSPRSKWKTII